MDDDNRLGRFILTGSVRADLDVETWPGTGRLIRPDMWGLSERGINGSTGDLSPLSVLADGDSYERLLANLFVLHAGPSVFALSDRIAAAPIASLWTQLP